MDIRFKFVPSYNTSEYFKLNKCVFFMHIPKSGGTTIDHIFAKIANIIGNFKYERFKYSLDYKKTKLFQICSPDLSPFSVKVVEYLPDSSRGSGGFGSTGN